MQKQINVKNLVASISISLLLVGCSTKDFFQTVNDYNHSQRTIDQIELLMEGITPSKPYQTVGVVSTYYSNSTIPKESLQLMRELAVEKGLDGVYDIHYAPMGTQSAGGCNGKGFVYTK
ncbi:MAG: hypothetical protein ABSD46_02415 [Bacteroidota bacterium]